MADAIRQQIEEFRALPDRSLAYSNLHHLHRLSANDPSSMEALSLSSPPLIPILLSDIESHDEEIAAQALKCLGFMLYHPSLVPIFSEEVAVSVLESLGKLIVDTGMKAICNLGLWCISVQQLSHRVVELRLDLLMKAVVHAMDNPFGSLSATFEAMQAVTKLATQFREKMRDNSDIWVPPLYRRLISNVKKERDMAERCLLKMKFIICPPTSTLSKAVKLDLEKKLLPSMSSMLHEHDCHQKVHMVQAWGWYVCLLGSSCLKNRNIINEMLKIPECTFTDSDPQVQIASLVVWKQLVDVLLPPLKIDLEANCSSQVNGLLRRTKVLIMPLKGIISSKCDISVRSSCLRTWHYLLSKLDISINHPSVLMTSFWSILESILFRGLGNGQSTSVWISCVDLLDDYILSKVKVGKTDISAERKPYHILDLATVADSKYSAKDCPIKWLSWKVCDLDFLLKMIRRILTQGLVMKGAHEHRKLAFSYSLRIFRSVLWGLKVELKMPSTCYEQIMFCITTVLKFVREVSEEASNYCAKQFNDFLWLSLQLVEVIREEMDPLIFVSPLYRVRLDLKYIKDMQSEKMVSLEFIKSLRIKSLVYMDLVSPMVYTTILNLSLMAQSIQTLSISETDDILRPTKHTKREFFPVNSLLNLHASTSFLYAHLLEPMSGLFSWLILWRIIAKGLLETAGSSNVISCSNSECDIASCTVFSWFLCYPFVIYLLHLRVSVSRSSSYYSDLCLISLQRELEQGIIIEVWKSLFDFLSSGSQEEMSSINNYPESLSEMLFRLLDENIVMLMQENTESSTQNSQKNDLLLVFGEIVICILKHAQIMDNETSGPEVINQDGSNQNEGSPINNSLGLAARFMEVSANTTKRNIQTVNLVVCRVFAAMTCLIERFFLKKDILLLMELISDPLIRWLFVFTSTSSEMQQSSILYQLQRTLEQIFACLQRSQPPIIFNSSFLGIQASLLHASLDHSHTPISDAAVAFWKATYHRSLDLNYPQCLLPVLDKLSRTGKIIFQPESSTNFADISSSGKKVVGLSKKRISGLAALEEAQHDNGCSDKVSPGFSRKRLKILEHPSKHERAVSIQGCDFGVSEYMQVTRNLKKADELLQKLRKV